MVTLETAKKTSKSLLARFGQDAGGNVMMLFALAIIPVLGLAGALIDYSRAATVRSQLNAAVDSAALMAARDAPKLTDAEATARINNWIRGNLHGDAASSFTSATIAIDRTQRTVNITANVNVDTRLAQLIGQTTVPVSSKSQAAWGTNKIELALALDNTGSMASSGKMTALKAASLDMIQIMKDATLEPQQIKLSVIPFNTQVKISTSYKDEPWLRYDQTRTTGSGKNKVTETISKSTWTGCVSDRDMTYDAQDNGPVGAYATLYPADFCDQPTLTVMRPLTDDWTALNATINAMTPVGNTNVTIGAMWGLASLSTGVPLTEAQAPTTPRLKKFMVLLTDGDNTENRFTTNGTEIDARTTAACNTIKAAGVTLYTIRVIDGDAALLKSCASSPSQYYDVKNASELTPVFKQIAGEISAVRLTQ